ncbi:MAG: hypothetical protein GXY85_08610, partial [Candidatus Brocadiaceae bacterium]|nr:hypothetical protein [Candidatus Brocadiaceae bacterium]
WFRQYVIGLGVGTVSALYGLIALWWGHTFLPGLKGGTATVTGAHGAGLALGYTAGGLYLFCRFFLHGRLRSEGRRAQIYLVENVLLLVLIASLSYVLWQVGTVG